jgi:hypothetical protein
MRGYCGRRPLTLALSPEDRGEGTGEDRRGPEGTGGDGGDRRERVRRAEGICSLAPVCRGEADGR